MIEPLLLNKSRGVPRVDDQLVSNGIFWRLRTGAPWADIPERYGSHATCVNRFNRWRKASVQDRLIKVISNIYDDDMQMIDSSSIRMHQHAANAQQKPPIRLHGRRGRRFRRSVGSLVQSRRALARRPRRLA